MLHTTYEKKAGAANFLSNLDVKHVSIVPKGANQIPFHGIKTLVRKQEGQNMAAKVIHSVVLPDTAEWAELAKQKGFEWMNDREVEVFGKTLKWTQVEKSAFEGESLIKYNIPDIDGVIVAGDLKPESRTKFAKAVALDIEKIQKQGIGDEAGDEELEDEEFDKKKKTVAVAEENQETKAKSGTDGNTEWTALADGLAKALVAGLERALLNSAPAGSPVGPPMLPRYPGLQDEHATEVTKMAGEGLQSVMKDALATYIAAVEQGGKAPDGAAAAEAHANAGVAKSAEAVLKAISDYAGYDLAEFGKAFLGMSKTIDGIKEELKCQGGKLDELGKSLKKAETPATGSDNASTQDELQEAQDEVARKRKAKEFKKALDEDPDIQKLFKGAVQEQLKRLVPGVTPASDISVPIRKAADGTAPVAQGSIW